MVQSFPFARHLHNTEMSEEKVPILRKTVTILRHKQSPVGAIRMVEQSSLFSAGWTEYSSNRRAPEAGS